MICLLNTAALTLMCVKDDNAVLRFSRFAFVRSNWKTVNNLTKNHPLANKINKPITCISTDPLNARCPPVKLNSTCQLRRRTCWVRWQRWVEENGGSLMTSLSSAVSAASHGRQRHRTHLQPWYLMSYTYRHDMTWYRNIHAMCLVTVSMCGVYM